VLEPKRENPVKKSVEPEAVPRTMQYARCGAGGGHFATDLLWLVDHIRHLPPFRSSVASAQPNDVLELDELWSFVGHKGRKRWLWVALCRRTRQVVAYVIGDRSGQTCRQLWQRIPVAYRHCRSYSDFWHAYEQLRTTGQHHLVGKDSGQTAHVERWNCTLRQRLARYVRKTLSFSKSDKFHHLITKWFIFDYNLSLTS
jgi:IS1 family transposase